MEKIKRFQKLVAQATLGLSAIALATVGLAIFVNVLCRYVFKFGMMWVEQYSRYMIIWSVFLAANVLIYTQGLMRVDFIDGVLPDKVKQVREIIYSMLFIIILAIVSWQGWVQARNYIGVSLMGIALDKFWVYLCIPLGTGLMLVQYLLNLLISFVEWKERRKQA